MDMDYDHMQLFVGLGLFVLSEVIGIAKIKPNSVTQLVLAAARRAFPYNPGR